MITHILEAEYNFCSQKRRRTKRERKAQMWIMLKDVGEKIVLFFLRPFVFCLDDVKESLFIQITGNRRRESALDFTKAKCL